MAVSMPLIGKRVTLRCAEERDAEFTLAIRNDPVLTEFIPRVKGSLEGQRAWIDRQRQKDGDYFYVVENNNGEKIGTLSFYDIDMQSGVCELGRYISYGNAMQNVEAVVLLLDYIFNKMHLKETIMNCDERNRRIIKFWERFGAVFSKTVPMGEWTAAQYRLTPEKYAAHRNETVRLLRL